MGNSSVDMRDAFFQKLYEIIAKDKNVIVLTADHGAFWLSKIQEDFPKQYLNVGISEQNMVSVASGLALSNKIVYVYSIVSFVTLRCLEQINIDVASMNLHINIIGVGAGFTYSTDGPTHHGTQDIAIMSALPNLSIYNCSDPVNTRAIAKIGHIKKGPKYIRIEKGVYDEIYGEITFENGIGLINHPNDISIMTSGLLMHKVLRAANELRKKNRPVSVIDIIKIKPIDEKLMLSILRKIKRLIIFEDNISIGGLHDKIGGILIKSDLNIEVHSFNLGDKFSFTYTNDRTSIEEKNKIGIKQIINTVNRFYDQK